MPNYQPVPTFSLGRRISESTRWCLWTAVARYWFTYPVQNSLLILSQGLADYIINACLQFQNGMHLPLIMSALQESQHLPWLPGNENQPLMLPDEPNFLPHRCALLLLNDFEVPLVNWVKLGTYYEHQ